MTIATWNVNSIRARLPRLLAWLQSQGPDVVCLQELKVDNASFPTLAIREAGYHAAVHGQRPYNGVAILSRAQPAQVERDLGDGVADGQARLISARLGSLRVLSLYAPNGAEVGSDPYAYKLSWLRRLRGYLERRCRPDELLAACGDFNVAPEPRDVCDPPAWATSVLFHPDARAALDEVRSWGLRDAFRIHHEEAGHYSWWDYRMLAFPRNRGLRIDHILVSEPLARLCRGAAIHRQERKGPKPSDHAPVVAEFEEAS